MWWQRRRMGWIGMGCVRGGVRRPSVRWMADDERVCCGDQPTRVQGPAAGPFGCCEQSSAAGYCCLVKRALRHARSDRYNADDVAAVPRGNHSMLPVLSGRTSMLQRLHFHLHKMLGIARSSRLRNAQASTVGELGPLIEWRPDLEQRQSRAKHEI